MYNHYFWFMDAIEARKLSEERLILIKNMDRYTLEKENILAAVMDGKTQITTYKLPDDVFQKLTEEGYDLSYSYQLNLIFTQYIKW